MSDLNIKELKLDEAQLLNNNFDITLKRDGCLIYFKGQNLISSRGVIRNDRFPHILKALRDNNFPECMGEMYIEGGKVFDVSRRENWDKAQFMPFDLTNMNTNRVDYVDKLIDELDSDFITKPVRFGDLTEGWNYVLENDEEGLILKNRNLWYKIKVLKEAKVKIKEWEQGKGKGTFILDDEVSNRISGTSMNYVNQFKDLKEQGKEAIAEIEFPYLTDNGHYFQPRLRRIYAEGCA